MGGIFLRQEDGGFLPLRKAPYDAEQVLQDLIGDHPEILGGENSDTEASGWLLVRREAPVATEPGGPSRWALDHLFLDSTGILTLVEVKRSSDPRIRREVVGQMLDYAANARSYWSVETLREWVAAEHEEESEQALAPFLDSPGEEEAYWAKVRTNLAAGKLRLVFVADEIPAELRRIVEFLNVQMTETEVSRHRGRAVRRCRGSTADNRPSGARPNRGSQTNETGSEPTVEQSISTE